MDIPLPTLKLKNLCDFSVFHKFARMQIDFAAFTERRSSVAEFHGPATTPLSLSLWILL